MEFKVVNKRLIYINEGYNLIKGENNNELISIEMPRYPNDTDIDYMSLSHRLTVTALEDSTTVACVILAKKEIGDNKINLSYPVTSEITSVGEKVFFKITSVGENDFIDITECDLPIKINGNSDVDRLPSETDIQQLLAKFQVAVENAREIANEAKDTADKALESAQTAKNEAIKATAAAQKADNSAISAEKNAKDSEKLAQNAANTVNELNSNAAEALANQANIKIEINDIKSYIGYTDGDIIGLHADFENNIFTRLGAAVGLNGGSDFDKFPMYGGRRRCNVLDDGTITAYYGDENFVEDGSNGQVMVYQPKFYYRVVPLKLEPITDGIGYHLRCANYYISATPKNGFKLHPAFYDENGNPVDYILFSAYEGSIFDTSENVYLQNDEQVADFSADKLSSIAGVKPCSGNKQALNRSNAERLAKNKGTGWHIDTIKAASANQLLMIIEFASFNMQSAIGQGAVLISDYPKNENHAIITGETSLLGNTTGTADGSEGHASISYRGIENPWGNILKFVNGFIEYIDEKGKACVYVCNYYSYDDNDKYEKTDLSIAAKNGYISSFGYSHDYDWVFIPSETGGNKDLPIGDFLWNGTAAYPSQYVLLTGGEWDHSSMAGAFCFSVNSKPTTYNHYFGCRLIYIPVNEIHKL